MKSGEVGLTFLLRFDLPGLSSFNRRQMRQIQHADRAFSSSQRTTGMLIGTGTCQELPEVKLNRLYRQCVEFFIASSNRHSLGADGRWGN